MAKFTDFQNDWILHLDIGMCVKAVDGTLTSICKQMIAYRLCVTSDYRSHAIETNLSLWKKKQMKHLLLKGKKDAQNNITNYVVREDVIEEVRVDDREDDRDDVIDFGEVIGEGIIEEITEDMRKSDGKNNRENFRKDFKKLDKRSFVRKRLDDIETLKKADSMIVVRDAVCEDGFVVRVKGVTIDCENYKDLKTIIRNLQERIILSDEEKASCQKIIEAFITSLVYDIICCMRLRVDDLMQKVGGQVSSKKKKDGQFNSNNSSTDLFQPWLNAKNLQQTRNGIVHRSKGPHNQLSFKERINFLFQYMTLLDLTEFDKYFPYHRNKRAELIKEAERWTLLYSQMNLHRKYCVLIDLEREKLG